jgi:CRP-like cAMP-binding protein
MNSFDQAPIPSRPLPTEQAVEQQTPQGPLLDHPFLRGLRPAHLHALEDCSMLVAFKAGKWIFHEGEPANRFYLIRSGSVALESSLTQQESVLIQTIGAGDVLGWSWLFPPYYWHFDARVIEDTQATFFYGTRLRERCEEDPSLGYELVRRMAAVMLQRLQATRCQLAEISDLALQSQKEALRLAARAGSTKYSDP